MRKLYLRQAAIAAFVLGSTTASADIYRWVDSKGLVHFGDVPQNNADKPVALPPLSTMQRYVAPRGLAEVIPESAPVSVARPKIISPEDETTTRDPEANLKVAVQAVLPEGHQLQYIFDGAPVGEPTQTSTYSLPPIERGEHTVEVAEINSDGKEVSRSKPSRVFHQPPIARRQ